MNCLIPCRKQPLCFTVYTAALPPPPTKSTGEPGVVSKYTCCCGPIQHPMEEESGGYDGDTTAFNEKLINPSEIVP